MLRDFFMFCSTRAIIISKFFSFKTLYFIKFLFILSRSFSISLTLSIFLSFIHNQIHLYITFHNLFLFSHFLSLILSFILNRFFLRSPLFNSTIIIIIIIIITSSFLFWIGRRVKAAARWTRDFTTALLRIRCPTRQYSSFTLYVSISLFSFSLSLCSRIFGNGKEPQSQFL